MRLYVGLQFHTPDVDAGAAAGLLNASVSGDMFGLRKDSNTHQGTVLECSREVA